MPPALETPWDLNWKLMCSVDLPGTPTSNPSASKMAPRPEFIDLGQVAWTRAHIESAVSTSERAKQDS